jgi:hypothetical protein
MILIIGLRVPMRFVQARCVGSGSHARQKSQLFGPPREGARAAVAAAFAFEASVF